MTVREGGWEFSKPQKNRKQHEINYKCRLFEINLDRERSSFFPQSQASEIMQINGKKRRDWGGEFAAYPSPVLLIYCDSKKKLETARSLK